MNHLSVHCIYVLYATNLVVAGNETGTNSHITAIIVYNCFILLLVIINIILFIIYKLNILNMYTAWGKPQNILDSAGYTQNFTGV